MVRPLDKEDPTMTRKAMTMVAGLAGGLAMAMPAAAGDFSLNLGVGVGRHGTQVGLGIQTGHTQPVAVAPAIRIAPAAPLYRVVTERVWIPVIEARYRDVPVVDALGRVIAYRREAYTVQSGYWKEIRRQVPVQAGCMTVVASGGCVGRPAVGIGPVIRPAAVSVVRAGAIRALAGAHTGHSRPGRAH